MRLSTIATNNIGRQQLPVLERTQILKDVTQQKVYYRSTGCLCRIQMILQNKGRRNARVPNCASVFKRKVKERNTCWTSIICQAFTRHFPYNMALNPHLDHRRGAFITTFQRCSSSKVGFAVQGVAVSECAKWSKGEMSLTLAQFRNHEVRALNGSSTWALSLPGCRWLLG